MSLLSYFGNSPIASVLPAVAINAKAGDIGVVAVSQKETPQSSKDDKDSPKEGDLSKLVLKRVPELSIRNMLKSSLAGKAGRGGKGLGRITMSNPLTLSVMSGAIGLSTTAGGVQELMIGSATLYAASDFVAFKALFECCRTIGCTVAYQPIGAGQAFVAGQSGYSVPQFSSISTDVSTSASFLTLLSTLPLSDRRNKYSNSGLPWRHSARFVDSKNDQTIVGATGGGAAMAVLGDWQSTAAFTTNVYGGVRISSYTHTGNISVPLGYVVVEFHTQWADRD